MSGVADGASGPRLLILGQARIDLPDGSSFPGLTRRVAFLSALALSEHPAVSRAELCALLWPDVPLPRARRSLSSLCYDVRRLVGADVVLTDGDHLSLNRAAIEVDATQFRAAVRSGRHESALALYGGPLLDGFAGMDGSTWGRFVDRKRLEYELLHEEARPRAHDDPAATAPAPSDAAPSIADGASARGVWSAGTIALTTMAIASIAVASVIAMPRAGGDGPALDIVVADFVTSPEDAELGATVAHALQIDLEGSERIRVLARGRLQGALDRRRSPDLRVTEDVAVELARREGIEAVLSGEVRRIGSGFVLITRLIDPTSGEVTPYGTERVSVADSSGLISGIDQLSESLRAGLGESAGALESRRPLASVTTASLRALELYTQAERVRRARGDGLSAVLLYEQAIATDSLFASAYIRKANAELVVGRLTDASASVARAYELRDRLSERDVHVVTGMYHQVVRGELAEARDAYEEAIAAGNPDPLLLVHAGTVNAHLGDLGAARELLEAAVREDSTAFLAWRYLVRVAWLGNRQEDAQRLIDDMKTMFPGEARTAAVESQLAASNLDLERAHHLLDSLRLHDSRDEEFRTLALANLASLELTRGRVSRAVDYMERARSAFARLELRHLAAEMEVRQAYAIMVFEHRFDGPLERLERTLAYLDRDSVPENDRPYGDFAVAFAGARDWESASEMVSRMGSYVDPGAPSTLWMRPLRVVQASVADPVARGPLDRWLPERAGGSFLCRTCGLPILAKELMHLGEERQALELYRRFRDQPNWGRALLGSPSSGADPYWLGIVLEDSGRLASKLGLVEEAVQAYEELGELWATADPPLQARANRARRQADSLSATLNR